ncbi:hypothetical protein [Natronosalvus rutilus]|uniref:DUF1102 domain-containing protein n=1 Tax=Natronosalvus rutilus TaxID=2953753 RepID=A0A9E7NCM0_9EURY|nr:hypothetical protein [Natronosalvus rutilus]UTF54408.1 hypothetical protein NGM29_03775 [Natronosalvus rutilus]
MRLNRRNVLVGLGAIVAGGGGALATGAFSQVEATRDVTVNTTGDASALLSLDLDTSYNGISDGDGDAIVIQFDDINDEAVTKFNNAFTVTNNGSEDVNFSISADDVPNALTFEDSEGNDIAGTDQLLTKNGGNIVLSIEVDLDNNDIPTAEETITFNATSTAT